MENYKQGGDSPEQIFGLVRKIGDVKSAVDGFNSAKGEGFFNRLKAGGASLFNRVTPGLASKLGVGDPFAAGQDPAAAASAGYAGDPMMEAKLNAMRSNQIAMQQQLAAPTVKKGKAYGNESPGQMGGSALAKTGCSRRRY